MKTLGILITTLLMVNLSAAVLTPITSSQKSCEATLTSNTYEVEAVCWKNKNGEFRLYFTGDSVQAVKDTRINSKYISNTDAACMTTTEYAYGDLFGASALDPRDVRPSVVTIEYAHLDASACFNN